MSTELVVLPLQTADGRPLVHKFYRQRGPTQGLLVTFPGAHYGVDGPLLYYPSLALLHAGWDTLAVTYGFQSAGGDLKARDLSGLLQECRQAVEGALAGRAYPRVALVGKSLGTGVVAHLCRDLPVLAGAQAAYLTPMLGTPFFDPAFAETRNPAFVALGTADRYYDAEALEQLRRRREFRLTVVEGADHSMNVPGDLEASLANMARVVRETVDFLLA